MPSHIIHKQKVHLHTTLSVEAFTLQNRISNVLKNDLPGKLELLFDRLSPNGTILRIDKLKLDLGVINEQTLETEFIEKVLEQLSQCIVGNNNNAVSHYNDPEASVDELKQSASQLGSLIYFLHHGYLPWYEATKKFSEWEASVLQLFSEKEWQQLAEELRLSVSVNNQPVSRLARQFSESFLEELLFHLHLRLRKNWNRLYADILAIIKKYVKEVSNADEQKIFLWKQVIAAGLTARNKIDFAIELLRNMYPAGAEGLLQKMAQKTGDIEGVIQDENDPVFKFLKSLNAIEPDRDDAQIPPKIENKPGPGKKADPDEKEFFTGNCGIVILHPFLVMYFTELDIAGDNQFKNKELQQRAVLLLHYLATGETEVAEFNLLIAKLLCGLDFGEPVPKSIELTEQEKEESANLLKAITQHWKPLNNTSAEGLRASFFQREGTLRQTEAGWTLHVEQKTIDILMNQLPWGIGTIKLPWMKNILNVEWN
jgi:hypothetical protein